MKMTASQLRADIYNLLDEVLSTGKPLEIERGGQILKIIPPGYKDPVSYKPKKNRFSEIRDRTHIYNAPPESIFDNNWLKDWKK